jgi:hypothetical protein
MVAAEAKLGKMTSKERKEQEKNAKVTKNIQAIWSKVVEIFQRLYKQFITPIAEYLMKILGFTGKIGDDLGKQKGVWEGIEKQVEKVFKWVSEIVIKLIDWLAGGGFKEIKSFFTSVWETAKLIGGVLWDIGVYLGEHKGILTIIVGLWAANKLGLFSMLGGLGKFGKGLSGIGKAAEKIPGDGNEGIMSKIGGKGGGTTMIKGAAAMVILAAATWVMAKSMQEFSTGVSWKGVAMGITSMLALVAAALILGALMMSGVGAVALIAGAAALVILAGAMWVLGKAMQEFSKSAVILIPVIEVLFEGIALIINTIAGAFVTMLDAIVVSFKSFAEMGREGGLLTAAVGMTAISVALGLFGGGSILAGIGSAIGDFFGGDPVKKFEKFGALGPSLTQTGEAMKTLTTSMQNFKDIGIRDMASATQELAKALVKLASASGKVNKAQKAVLRTQALKGFGQLVGLIKEDSPVGRQAGSAGGPTQADIDALRKAQSDTNILLMQIRDNANRNSQYQVIATEGLVEK